MISNRDKEGKFSGEPLDVRLKRQLERCSTNDNGCLIWNGAKAGGGGYPVIRNSENIPTRVSRLVLEKAGFFRPSEKHLACHTCDTPSCVNVEHLFWGTPRDNAIDARNKNRLNKPSGEHLEKIKAALKIRWSDELVRKKHCDMMRERKVLLKNKGIRKDL